MRVKTGLKYAVLAVSLLLVVGLLVSIVMTVIGLIWAAVIGTAALLVVFGIAYTLVKGVHWLRRRGRSADEPPGEPADPVEDLVERYVDGELTEGELDRRLDLLYGRPPPDDIDAELQLLQERG